MTTTQHHLDLDAIQARADAANDEWHFAQDVRASAADVPALIAEVHSLRDELTNAPRVLEGDWQHITQALENLPDGAVVQSSAEARADRECAVFVAVQGFTGRTWEGSGVTGSFATQYLAKHCAPLTVINA